MTESEAIKELHEIRPRGGIIPQKRAEALDVAINALEKQITRKPDEYVSELLDDEIKLPKISRLEVKAIKVALYHQWLKITDDNGKAISCSQEMADATYKMLSLFDNLIKESDKEQENGYR